MNTEASEVSRCTSGGRKIGWLSVIWGFTLDMRLSLRRLHITGFCDSSKKHTFWKFSNNHFLFQEYAIQV